MEKNKKFLRSFYDVCLLVSFMLITASSAIAQEESALTRNKFWITPTLQGGASLTHRTKTGTVGQYQYPAYFGCRTQSVPNYSSSNGVGYSFVRNNEPRFTMCFMWTHWQHHFNEGTYEHKHTYNYNFAAHGPTMPEEMIELSAIGHQDRVSSANPFTLGHNTRTMGWSIPKYDDFIIYEVSFTNVEDVPFYNFVWINVDHGEVCGAWNHNGGTHGKHTANDVEYVYDAEHDVFVYYDAEARPHPTGEPLTYIVPPGDETQDVGDPGNIKILGSINFQLYSPQVISFSVLGVTPNANNPSEPAKPEYYIGNYHTGWKSRPETPDPDNWRRHSYTTMQYPDTFYPMPTEGDPPLNVEQIMLYPQAKMSYRAAAADPTVTDGNIFERNPVQLSGMGPYHIMPGETIKFYRILCGGDMDRNISMKGGSAATKMLDMDFVTEETHASLVEWRKNYAAAMELINNNFEIPADVELPPPTPGPHLYSNPCPSSLRPQASSHPHSCSTPPHS